MAGNDLPDYFYKLAITEDIFSKAISKILEDYNIFLEEDKALKLFYSITVTLMNYLNTHPGFYYKLKYVDITSDDENFLAIKRTSDVTEDMVDIPYLFKKFCSLEVAREELESNLDTFAQAILGVKEIKAKEIVTLQKLINDRMKKADEVKNLTSVLRNSKKTRKAVLKRRKEDLKAVNREYLRRETTFFTNQLDLHHREQERQRTEALEEEVRKKWEEDKNNFPLK